MNVELTDMKILTRSTTMSMVRPLYYIFMLGCCFSLSEALFSNLLQETELILMKKIAVLKKAYEEAKEKIDEEIIAKQDPEVYMNASELIESKGYPCENHDVITDDGFILGIQRIPHGLKDTNKNKARPVVYLQHGLLGSSTNFLTNLENESLAYVLADAGYDVWLGNSRGNTYSSRHTLYPKTSKKFWAWSFDEMAKYDLPATLNYITNMTNEETMYYIAHSQGTLLGFMEFSQDPEIAKKIRLMVALGPVLTVGHMTSPIRMLTYFSDTELFDVFGKKNFLPKNRYIDFMAETVCKEYETRFVCLDVIELIAGFDHTHLNVSRLPVYLTHCPAGTSTRNMAHFAQNYRTKKCCMYDFGSAKENELHYGQPFPPQYNVTNMDVPVVLYSGSKDSLADPQDVKLLIKQLKNVVFHQTIEGWAHLEFIWGIDGRKVFFNEMLKLMKKF